MVALWAAFRRDPARLISHFDAMLPGGVAPKLATYLTVVLAITLAAALAALTAHWLPRRLRRVGLGVVVVANLVFFSSGQYIFESSPLAYLQGSSPGAQGLAAATGPTGRFVIYDTSPTRVPTNEAVGGPDLNLLDRVRSIDGYGSIVPGRYARATGVHSPGLLDAPELAGTTFDRLDLTTLAAGPGSLARPVRTGGPSAPSPHDQPRQVAPGSSLSWYLGSAMEVSSVVLADLAPTTVGNAGNASRLKVGLVASSGSITFAPADLAGNGPGSEAAAFPAPVRAVAVVVVNTTTGIQVLSAPEVKTPSGAFVLDGPLALYLQPPHWRWQGSLSGLGLFRNTRAKGLFWLEPLAHRRSVSGASVHLVRDTAWGTQAVEVSSPGGAVLVRSVVYLPGWSATLVPDGPGRARTAHVRRIGLVQGIDVPSGSWTVTWRYRPASVDHGVAITLAGLAGTVLLALMTSAWRHRPRRR
ncbi:MAG: hypothetical protein ACRD0J_12800, partial [Acidimicrobiales bacterium]